MDEQLRRDQRRAFLEAGESARLSHARGLSRAGRPSEARGALYDVLAARRLDDGTLGLLRDLAISAGDLGAGSRDSPPHPQLDLIVRGPIGGRSGRAEVAPTVAFTGLPSVDAAQSVEALLGLFSRSAPEPRSCEWVRSYRAMDEHVIDFRVPLREPWRVSTGFAAHALRVFNLPGAPGATKLRVRLLRSVSALAFVVGPEDDDGDVSAYVRALDRELRRSAGLSLNALPLIVQYSCADQAAQHAERTRRLGLQTAAWAVAKRDALGGLNGAAELLALLLLDLGRGVGSLARPRGSA